ncbi:MAG: DUF2817 domain-containing protein [Bdellovibrionales bacterium]|nr:DUF2817 domain-containing protein [Bdellovibrionales bacterium]
MKKILYSLALISLASQALATVKIEEELFVFGQKPEVVKELILAGSVEVDHVSSEGFELYGSKGLSKYLDGKKIAYFDMKSMSKSAMADYPTHAQITAKLQAAAAKNPSIMKLFSIGKSVKGKDLWVMKISDNVNVDEVEPEFKYISSMHGDEITGREMTVSLIEEMVAKYGSDAEITELINNTEIYIMPSMNPDGSERKQRGNANGVDLNRNFPDLNNPNSAAGREIENQHVMKFQTERKFSLSANFHGGTIVANYPWDSKYDRHPLDGLVKEFSLAYADLNPEMRSSTEFPQGITNGADWYVVKGGMQDWSCFFYNDLQITLEVSHAKYPNYKDIPGFYKSNRDSMVNYMKQIHRGAGFKMNRANISGTVAVKQISPEVKDLGSYAFSRSEFYKVLPEGQYSYTVTEKNKAAKEITVFIERDKISSNGDYTILE